MEAARRRERTCGATFGAKSMPGEVWATASPCARSRRTPLPSEAVCVGVITTDRAGNDSVTGARMLVLRGSDGRSTTFGLLGVGERLLDDACVSAPGPCRCTSDHPETKAHVFRQGAFARSVNTQSLRHAVGALVQQAPERAAQRYKYGLSALRGTESLNYCKEATWSQCSAPCVVRTVVVWCDNLWSATALQRQLLGDCWLCATSNRTVHLDCVPGEFLRAESGPCRTTSPFFQDLHSSLFGSRAT